MSIQRRFRRRHAARRIVLGSFGVLGAAMGPQLALAQAQAPTEEVIVTGSRVSQSGFDSAQPLTSINSDQIEKLGIVNTGDVLRTLPQNTPFFTETNVGIGNFNVGSQLANLRGLNPFFGTRTLTLVDTKRVVPTNEGGAADLTLIPSMLVERTEVVTGGASAAYGSDAIAGVVNVILNKKLEGFKMQVDYGETSEGDGGDTHGSFAWGTAFSDNDRGHVMAGIEYQKQDRIGPCSQTRDWCKEGWAIGNNTSFNTPAGVGNGLPNFNILPGAKQTPSENGTITPCLNLACTVPTGTPPPAPLAFNADGTALTTFNPGTPAQGFLTRIGGDGALLGYNTSNIRPEVERYSAMARVSFDLSDRLSWYAELANAHSDAASTPANGGLGPLAVRIQPDNAFLTPGVRATIPFGGTLNRAFMPAVVNANNTTENTTTRFVTGFDAQLGEKWNWDAYYQHGENENHQRLFHNAVSGLSSAGPERAYDFVRWGLDAVRSNPADPNSPIVCRATVVGDPAFRANAAGCVPLDIFGNDGASQAAIDYAYRTLKEDNKYTQDVIGVNFRSDIAQGWAGPIAFATGLEWRSDDADTTHDIPNQPWYSSYFLSYGLDRGGTLDVVEAYAEVQVPMSKKLQTDFAVRETSNDATSATNSALKGSHDFASWKASAIYDPLEWLRFRATLSRDVRAANFRELFLPRVTNTSTTTVTNPWASGAIDSTFNATTGGNPALIPEEADTTTFGAVFSFDNVRFSADWFEIDLGKAITQSPGNQPLIDACFKSNGTSPACARVTGYGTADITAIDASAVNLAGFLTRGWDYEATWDVPMRTGSINLRFIGTYLYDMIVDTGFGIPPIDYEGQSGPVGSFGSFNTQPRWQARAFVTYGRNRFSTTLETRYVGSGKLNAVWTEASPGTAGARVLSSVNDNSVDDAYYLNWSGSFDIKQESQGNQFQVFWAVNNLLNEDPAIAPGGNAYPTNPVFFDTLGQRVRLGVRLSF
ncbi:MAG TPA: TonB-dependent receptor [Gammaproteobacteria bacterium]|nr:TonB-dependent receptor [Gammaproteobacteria bacterium]